jgi:hypothetical protein
MGPLSSSPPVDGLAAQVDDAIAKGATVLTGGSPLDQPGAWYQPTVLTGVTRTCAPSPRSSSDRLLLSTALSSEDEAVELANNSAYGLGAVIQSTDAAKAQEIADRLDAGMVYINEAPGTAARTALRRHQALRRRPRTGQVRHGGIRQPKADPHRSVKPPRSNEVPAEPFRFQACQNSLRVQRVRSPRKREHESLILLVEPNFARGAKQGSESSDCQYEPRSNHHLAHLAVGRDVFTTDPSNRYADSPTLGITN